MKNLIVLFLLFSNIVIAQENKVEVWLAEKQTDSLYNYLTQKKEKGSLSNREYSLLIYSTFFNEQYKNGLAFTLEWENNALKRNDSASVISAISYRTKFYHALGNYQKSIDLTKKQIAYYEKKNNFKKVIHNKLNLGLVYFELKDFQKAKQLYKTIPQDSITNLEDLTTFYTNYSNILAGLGDQQKSLEYMLKNLEIVKNELPEELPLSYSNIASLLYEMNKYNRSLVYLDSATYSLTSYKNLWYKQLIYQNKYTVWTGLKKSDSAFYYLEKLRKIDKEIVQQDLDEEIEALKTALKNEKELQGQIKEALLKVARSERNRLWLLSSGLTLLLIGISLFYFLRLKHIRTKNKNTQLEINLLRSQIKPHFIFNTLASIQSLIRQEKNNASIQYLNNFAKLMRQVLESSRKNNVQLSSEIELLKKYVELQQLRKDDFDFEVHLSSQVREMIDDIVLPSLAIQPFVENAIQHGFKNIDYRGMIRLNFFIESDYLHIEIDDNGSGLKKKNTTETYHSLATTITLERLASLDREMNSKSELLIKNKITEKGVLVTMKLPVILYDD